jgi:hypothetical protein
LPIFFCMQSVTNTAIELSTVKDTQALPLAAD